MGEKMEKINMGQVKIFAPKKKMSSTWQKLLVRSPN